MPLRRTPTARIAIALAALALLAAGPVGGEPAGTASAPPETPIVSGVFGALGGEATGFLTKAPVLVQGGTARFHNIDIDSHNVEAVDKDADDEPLFASQVIGFLQDTEVVGVSDLEVGVYEFICRPHPNMRGFLVVVPDPGLGGEPGEADAADWPVFGRDLANSRHADAGPDAGALRTYSEAWRYTTAGAGDFPGTPVVVGDRVYMASSGGLAVALDADSGAAVWQVELSTPEITARTTASVAYHNGVVYVPVSGQRTSGPSAQRYAPLVVALRAADGQELWRTFVDDEQPLGDLYGSPVVWETTVPGEDGEEQPFAALYLGTSSWDSGGSGASELHLGTVVALDLLDDGKLLWRTYMHEDAPRTKADVGVSPVSGKKYDGAAVWSTPAVDTEAGELFVGTGNGYESSHALVDSLVKLDVFTGDVLDFYSATETDAWQLTNPTRGVDADFGASPQLVDGPGGERWLGAGQKNMHLVEELAGSSAANTMVGLTRYHMIDRDTMQPVWVTPVGPGYWWGGITGATAYDGERIYGSTVYGQLFALDKATGLPVWVTSSGDAVLHMAHTQVANGVVYSTDGKGFVGAWDAATGVLLWTRPMAGQDAVGPSAAGVAIVGDRIYTALGFDAMASGGIFAFTP